MALDPGSGRRSVSPESSGRDSPIPRQWRNQLGGAEPPTKDKAYKRYAAGVDKALALFETALEEWADYISFLNRLLKALQARPQSVTVLPSKATVAKRLSQCLNPALPSGVHQKTLEVYNHVFSVIDRDGLSRDLPLYLPGLAPTLSFASLSVRSPYLDLLERYFLKLDARSLRPAMKSIILALLPGLEDETSEDFDRTLQLLSSFKVAIRGPGSDLLTDDHSSGDAFFWQCFFLASITSQSRRSGALAYLVRFLPTLGSPSKDAPKSAALSNGSEGALQTQIATIVTTPEPGLLVRCFAAGLADDQLLIQRGFLDLLVTHVPLDSSILNSKVKAADLELLLRAAVGVVTRRDMSLNRRLWSWLLGPEPSGTEADQATDHPTSPSHQQAYLASRTSFFETHGLQPLTKALLSMIRGDGRLKAAELARPYRICLSLMDRWEIGGLIVPEVFLPVVESVRRFKAQATSKSEFIEVLRSASVFFDGIESGLIYGELFGLLAQAIAPGSLGAEARSDKLSLINFVITHFNVREEEMITVHAPLTCVAALCMLEDANSRHSSPAGHEGNWNPEIGEQLLGIVGSLLELIPERAFLRSSQSTSSIPKSTPTLDILKKIRSFYMDEQGNIDISPGPLSTIDCGNILLSTAADLICDDKAPPTFVSHLSARVRILNLLLSKTTKDYDVDGKALLHFMHTRLHSPDTLPFPDLSSLVNLATHLHHVRRIDSERLSGLVSPLVGHIWPYVSALEPKHHVEAVRCLWQLQTALSSANRDIEAALCTIVAKHELEGERLLYPMDIVRSFGVLWSHSLQDSPTDRRPSRTLAPDSRISSRLAGTEHFEVMLTQPLFLILDVLLDETSRIYVNVRSWLRTTIGIDRLFLVFVSKMSDIPFLQDVDLDAGTDEASQKHPRVLDEADDLDLCLYYIRTLYHVLRTCGDVALPVLVSKHLSFSHGRMQISSGGEDGEITLQDFFVRVCLRCVTAEMAVNSDEDFQRRASELCRFALTIMHHFFSTQHGVHLADPDLENVLIARLLRTIGSGDTHVQVLLLDVVYAVLKLREDALLEPATSPTTEKRRLSVEPSRNSRPSLSMSDSRIPAASPPPPMLLKCLLDGLSSSHSRSALEHWVSFLGHCLPFYSSSVFQVLIPLVETLCKQIGLAFSSLSGSFQSEHYASQTGHGASESSLIWLLNGLEQVLARAHDQLLTDEARVQLLKAPDQPQSIFGSMVSGVFQSDAPRSRSATANDRLTVHLAFQDAVRMCYRIWCWGQGEEGSKQDVASAASFSYTSLRTRNRARRLLEHLFAAEPLECLETLIDIWRNTSLPSDRSHVFSFLASLDAARPRQTMPYLFNSIYSRTNPSALEPSRKSTMTISLSDSDLVVFLVDYARSLDDDAMDEIWQDCIVFLKDLLGNPFPHRQTLPNLLEFTAILGVKVDNTNFGEQRKMRRELGDLFLRLLAAIFTTRPVSFTEPSNPSSLNEKRSDSIRQGTSFGSGDGPDHVVSILAAITPDLPKILVENDRVLSAAGTISTSVVSPTLRSKIFPGSVSYSTMKLLQELSRLPGNQKTWKKDVGEGFNDSRFFGMDLALVRDDCLPLLRQWTLADKEKLPDVAGRINPPSTAGIVFGVGATSARLEADRKTQLNLRRIATLVLSSAEDAYVTDLPLIVEKLVELLAATATSSPSSTTRADIYMVVRAMVLKTSPIHLAPLWPVVNAEIHAAISSVVAPDQSAASETYTNTSVLQACKLLDLLICAAPDDFQLHEWLFVTDTIDAVYRSSASQPIALVDELSEELGHTGSSQAHSSGIDPAITHMAARGATHKRRPLLGSGGISDNIGLERKDELVAKVLRPFFSQLSIFAFESTYALGVLDWDFCLDELIRDLFDERTIVRAL